MKTRDNYVCRDCQQTRWVGSVESDRGTHYSGRVKCFTCGGTMDPTPNEVDKLDRVRKSLKREFR